MPLLVTPHPYLLHAQADLTGAEIITEKADSFTRNLILLWAGLGGGGPCALAYILMFELRLPPAELSLRPDSSRRGKTTLPALGRLPGILLERGEPLLPGPPVFSLQTRGRGIRGPRGDRAAWALPISGPRAVGNFHFEYPQTFCSSFLKCFLFSGDKHGNSTPSAVDHEGHVAPTSPVA